MRPVLRCLLSFAAWLSAAPVAAQSLDTVGVVDTLSFGTVEAAPGRSVALPLYVVNDRTCFGLTIPVAYPAAEVRADSVTFRGGRVSHFGGLTTTIDEARGRVLIGATQLSGAGLAAGSGPVAWLHLSVPSDAPIGTRLVVDTGYFNEPGKLLFLGGQSGSDQYLPFVVPGGIDMVPPNHAPNFLVAEHPSVREGDSLVTRVFVSDADGDPFTVELLNRPPGARFTLLGGGEAELVWPVPYVGPYSSVTSPRVLNFVAHDGEDATSFPMNVRVVNVNRPPVVHAPDTVYSSAFDSVYWQADATDPDLDLVSITVLGTPPPARISPGNPLQMQWRPIQADTGIYPITIVADDHNGGQDQMVSVLQITPGDRVEFAIDTVSGYLGQQVTLQIFMCNQETVSGLELLIYTDPTAATILGVDRQGTRIEDWEMMAVDIDFAGRPGDTRVIARADLNDGSPTPALAPGLGPILNIRMQLVSDDNYTGLSFPARFVFNTSLANTATDEEGGVITQDQIAYTHGEVRILEFADKLLGDINLNGLAYEIGDVVYFANYFSNPAAYPLNFQQRANSDTNGDGAQATIADLVYMIQVISGGSTARVAPVTVGAFTWEVDTAGRLWLAGDGPLGAMYMAYRMPAGSTVETGPAAADMTAQSGQEGALRRLLLYALDGSVIRPDRGAVLTGLQDARVVSVQLSDPAGHVVAAKASDVRPTSLRLLGNFPNPFNPQTSIRFALSEPGHVELEIYNVLGHRVRTLAGSFDAGTQELIWDGRDHAGREVASGIYFYRLDNNGTHHVRRMLLLK